MLSLKDVHLGVIGLGYVGLPLAVEFARHYKTTGFDINTSRVNALREGIDDTQEVSDDEMVAAKLISYSSSADDLSACNVYIVTVPTPIDGFNRPDLSPLEASSKTIGKCLSKGDVVIYESTVYPGATEEVCVPILEQQSGLVFNKDFYVGYSPERINPGDKKHRFTTILKVTSGSTPEVADFVDQLYASVVTAGTYKASSIKVAEAAKVIENTQRDLNIALVNELALIFDKLGIDTLDVLEAAGTKWNFLPFRPGLVGGHCISVDPYYLTHKAQEVGYHAEVILAGRRINDEMGAYVVNRVMKLMTHKQISLVDANVLVMGLTFKENCPDVRNTGVVDIVQEFSEYGVNIDVCDPWVNAEEAYHEHGIRVTEAKVGHYDAIVLAVAHDQFKEMGVEGIRALGKDKSVLFDVKCTLDKNQVDGRL